MRLSLDPRAQRLLRRLPRDTLYSATELVLIGVLAIECARLIYAVITPVSPLGDWRPAEATTATASPGVLGSLDPFFRLSGAGGPVVVTGLNLTLFGTRADQASGRGSAIIGLPDGTQASFAVGEAILPGVTLKSVAFDSVTIRRGEADEQLYLDQSQPATNVAPTPSTDAATGVAMPVPPPQASAATVRADALRSDTQLTPRIDKGVVTGLRLQPAGVGESFRAAGLEPGDVLVAVNGVRVMGAENSGRFQSQISQGGAMALEVERGGRSVTVNVQVAK